MAIYCSAFCCREIFFEGKSYAFHSFGRKDYGHLIEDGIEEDVRFGEGKWKVWMTHTRVKKPTDEEVVGNLYYQEMYKNVITWLEWHDFEWSLDHEEVYDLFFERINKKPKVWRIEDESWATRARRWAQRKFGGKSSKETDLEDPEKEPFFKEG
ncbi:uncharacterized protein [Parasteatoda tepidariorum]|uniref:uncharacterized protein n=1 Tax=Parasteatoda tepidariorum TaxID=114398 RepID=UPI0039BCC6E4